MSTGDKGAIVSNSKTTAQYASDLFLAVTGSSSVGLIDEAVLVQGKESYVIGEGGSALIDGKNIAVTIPVNADSSVVDFSDIKDWPEKFTKFNKDDLEDKAKFTFRTSKQAGTDKGIEPWEPNKKFTMYQPYWQVSKEHENPLIKVKPEKMESEEINGTKCWPGKDAVDKGEFVVLKKQESNVDKYDLSKKREELSNKIKLNRESFSKFRI
jgi:hypothetical protein